MEKSTNYDDANQFCKNQGARLFEPKSEMTNKLVFEKSVQVFGGEFQSWIGINDIAIDGEFVFESSGEKVSLFLWHPKNKFRSNEDCVMFGWPYNKEKWADRPCDENWYSICEFDKVRRKPRGGRSGRPRPRHRIHKK